VVGNIRNIVCNNFNRLVDASRMAKAEIARQMGVSATTMQRWKTGESFPELPNIEKLANVLGVDPVEFYATEMPVLRELPISRSLQKMAAVPDEVYELAEDMKGDEAGWDIITKIMKGRIEDRKKARRSQVPG
jgi:transcriptional regulator with XRE-family HTH domain